MTNEEIKAKLSESITMLDVVAAMVHSEDIDLGSCSHGLSRIIDNAYTPIMEVIEALDAEMLESQES